MQIWQIYDSPDDYPGFIVIRSFLIGIGDPRPSPAVYLCSSIDQARRFIPPGLIRFARSPGDHPSIVEAWI